ncbi:hypothetical protein IEQ34_006406 [Dendrobium chrysotoxum]|uniref:Uncharacterized protein n=1 Tax=Dendrobium chrysotoxum TaxID=161865 RepID=A0AAV7HE19_DENCH|nr:hypothetical protein IEQ34_006406 [Dendrobium chrysotoxum]
MLAPSPTPRTTYRPLPSGAFVAAEQAIATVSLRRAGDLITEGADERSLATLAAAGIAKELKGRIRIKIWIKKSKGNSSD